MDFGDPNHGLANFAQKLKDKAAAQGVAPIDTNAAPAAQTIEPVIQTQTEPVQPTPVATVEPVAEPKPEPDSTNPISKDDDIEPWDKDITQAAHVAEGPIKLEDLSSALKLENIKSKDDIVAHFTQRETRIKELETAQQAQLLDVPEELREVIEVTRKGGDWKAYLGARVIDYSQADPIGLFEQLVENSPRFRKDGVIDQSAVDLELSQIPDAVKEAQGNIIKQNLMTEQSNKRNAIVAAAEQKRSEFNRGVSDAATNISKTLSKEKIGVTLEPKHSEFLYQGIRDGSLIKKHLGNTDVSGIDPNKLVRTLAIAEWGERFAEHQLKQGVVQGKKAMLADKQNVQLITPSIPVNPNSQEGKPATPAQKLKSIFSQPQTGERRL